MKNRRSWLGQGWARSGRSLLVGTWFVWMTGAAQVLPPPPPEAGVVARWASQPMLRVEEFRFEGNTVFSAAELSALTAPYTHRDITSEELEEARRAVSLHYVSRGYVNSGAILPDQDPSAGVVVIRVVEGVLSGIELRGNRWLRESYLVPRIERWAGPPLNLEELKEGLQILRQNGNVQRINAELKPGNAPGEAILDVHVEDRQPFRAGVQFDNERPPSVGENQIWLLGSDVNLTGHSDVLDVRYGMVQGAIDDLEWSGMDNVEASYLVPVTRYDTTVGLFWSRLNSSLVEESFRTLDVRSLTSSYGIMVRQPVWQTANREFALSMGFDHRRNESSLLGERFNLSPGAEDGEMKVSVLRVSQEWVDRGQDYVLGLRSTFNFGLDVLDASDNGITGDPNGRYFSWLGQGQYIRRLFNTANLLVLRVAGQWTGESLLGLEQMSVGGRETVRGYRENQLVRDTGLATSVEFRIPVWFDGEGAGIVHLAPFFDFGGGWNVQGSSQPSTLSSAGIGLLATPWKQVAAELYWGHPFRDIDIEDDNSAQDLGLHFRLNISAF